MTDKHLTDTSFSELNLHPSLMLGLKDAGFSLCTPIQALALPPALKGQDVAGQAQTGTGKTAAFLLATFQRLLESAEKAEAEAEAEAEAKLAETSADPTATAAKDSETGADSETAEATPDQPKKKPASPARKPRGTGIKSLILAPTRELAIQIHKDAVVLGKHTGLKLALAYGGTGYESQRKEIEDGADILIGTPGRVIDYFKQKVFHLEAIEVAVMDEADRMFDLGFITDIRYLLRRMPDATKRLNLLFSATLSFRVEELAYEHMNAPEQVKVESEMVVDRIEEIVYYPAQDEKIRLLVNLITASEHTRSLIFVNTKHEANRVYDWLTANHLKTSVLSGDVAQDRREKLLKAFHDGKTSIMVATDVAARGLHIPDVSHVYNYDLPQDAEDYVHRAGRTARAGASGHAVSLACEKYAYGMMDIEKFIGHALPVGQITPELLAKLEVTPQRRPEKPRRDTRGGRARPSSSEGRGGRTTRSRSEPRQADQANLAAKPPQEKTAAQAAPAKVPKRAPKDPIEYIPPPDRFSIRFGEIPLIG